MRLAEMGKVMIQVGCNEFARKEDNEHVPYTPEEITLDATECAAAGAAMIHFHSRTADGSQALEDDSNGANIYRRTIELTAQSSDVIMFPTGHYRGLDPTSVADLPPVFFLLDDPPAGAPLEVAPLDGFRLAQDKLYPIAYPGRDPLTKTLAISPSESWGEQYLADSATPSDALPARPVKRPYVPSPVLSEIVSRGLVPCFSPFDLTQFRLVYHLCREGFVPEPALTQIMLYGDRIWGPSPRAESLDVFLNEWSDDVDAEHVFMPVSMVSVDAHDELVGAALDRGMNIRVGIGDNSAIFEGLTNAELVQKVADAARKRGLEPASPNEVRSRFNLQPRVAAA